MSQPIDQQLENSKSAVKRRPHHKSRLGCYQCKQRKVKCDESKPQCDKCVRGNTQCSFLAIQPQSFRHSVSSASPTPTVPRSPQLPVVSLPKPQNPLPPAPITHSPLSLQQYSSSLYQAPPAQHGPADHLQCAGKSFSNVLPPLESRAPSLYDAQDMELMWNYSRKTAFSLRHYKSVDWSEDVWSSVIPEMAFKCEYLMRGLLSISALHLAYLQPEEKEKWHAARDRHMALGLAQFRVAMTFVNEETCHSCWIFSVLLALTDKSGSLFSFDPIRSGYGLIGLLRGGLVLTNSFTKEIHGGPLSGMFRLWYERKKELEFPVPEDQAQLTKLEQYWSPVTSRYSKEHAEILQTSMDMLKELFSLMSSQDTITPIACAIAWPSSFSDEFMRMLSANDEAALLILAHFSVLLHRVKDTWWVEGEAPKLLRKIREILGPNCEPWIQWPVEQVGI